MSGRFTLTSSLLLVLVLLLGCQSDAASAPELPASQMLRGIPIMEGAEPYDPTRLPMSITAVTQAHRETVDDEVVAHFWIEQEFLDTVSLYDREMRRLGWRFIDALQFGDGGNLRRYHREQERAILAFEPRDGGTQFMLMQGQVR
jgi:hypothetical protein